MSDFIHPPSVKFITEELADLEISPPPWFVGDKELLELGLTETVAKSGYFERDNRRMGYLLRVGEL